MSTGLVVMAVMYTTPPSPLGTLSAIALDWQALTVDDAGDVAEIVQFEDSATYGPETLVWPRPPGTQAARRAINLSLTIQAAERERPTLLVQDWTVPASDPRPYCAPPVWLYTCRYSTRPTNTTDRAIFRI